MVAGRIWRHESSSMLVRNVWPLHVGWSDASAYATAVSHEDADRKEADVSGAGRRRSTRGGGPDKQGKDDCASKTTPGTSYWSACALERLPVVLPERPKWEIEYKEWQERLHAKQFKVLPPTFTDDVKTEREELKGGDGSKKWSPAPRRTAADASGDRKTLARRLDERLFLVLKRKGGDWGFAMTEIQEEEASRRAAERALSEAVGDAGYQPYFVGNAPAAHTVDENGGTVFYHRCQLVQGVPVVQQGYEDFAWVTSDEFHEYFSDSKAVETLQKMV